MQASDRDPSLPMAWNVETDWPGNYNSLIFTDVDVDSSIASLSLNHSEGALELFSTTLTTLEPSISTSDFSLPFYGLEENNGEMNPEVGLELEVETVYEQPLNNIQQPNYGCRSAQQLMSSQTPPSPNTAMKRFLNDLISGCHTEVASDLYNMEVDKETLTLDELGLSDLEPSITDLNGLPMSSPTTLIGCLEVSPWDNLLEPVQDTTISGFQEIVEDNILNFMNLKDKDVKQAESTTLPIPTEKRGRGRPKKEQPKPILEPEYSQLKPCLSPTTLPERNCKTVCLQKIQSFLTEGCDLEASERKRSSDSGTKKRLRKVARKFEQDPDYKEVDICTNTHLLTDIHCSQDAHQKRRKMNNDASKRSRDKRKHLEEEKEKECKDLEARFKYLKATSAKLDTAYSIVRDATLASKSNEGIKGCDLDKMEQGGVSMTYPEVLCFEKVQKL